MQNSLARVVCRAPYRSSATLLRQSLHWLPIEARITFIIAVLTYKVRNRRQPTYLSSMITDYKPARFLRSAVSDLVIPRTETVTASRAYRIAASKVWNSLPATQIIRLHQRTPSSTKRLACSTWRTIHRSRFPFGAFDSLSKTARLLTATKLWRLINFSD